MANMSYCRFRNTLEDFHDIVSALAELQTGDGYKLSNEELRAAKKLAVLASHMIAGLAEFSGVAPDELFDNDDKLKLIIEEINSNGIDE